MVGVLYGIVWYCRYFMVIIVWHFVALYRILLSCIVLYCIACMHDACVLCQVVSYMFILYYCSILCCVVVLYGMVWHVT